MRHAPSLILLAAALSLAGCVLVGPGTLPVPQASAKPTAKKAPAKKPPRLPERVNLFLPKGLGMVAAGAGNLVGQDGGSLIGNDGGSIAPTTGSGMVAAGAGNMVAAGGRFRASLPFSGTSPSVGVAGNAVVKAPAFRVAQAEDPCAVTAQGSFEDLVRLNIGIYVDTARVANAVLRGAMTAGLDVEAAKTFNVDVLGVGPVTAQLGATEAGAGVLQVAVGEAFSADKELLSLTYESPTKGRLAYRPRDRHPIVGRYVIASRFDLAAGEASADGVTDDGEADKPGMRIRAHWEFRQPRDAAPGKPTFTMQVAAHFSEPALPCQSGPRAMTIHAGGDGRAAVRMGRVLPGAQTLSFTRNDGKGYAAEADDATAFYIGDDGKQLQASAADTKLKGLLPTPTDFKVPFPADPSAAADPFADPAFKADPPAALKTLARASRPGG